MSFCVGLVTPEVYLDEIIWDLHSTWNIFDLIFVFNRDALTSVKSAEIVILTPCLPQNTGSEESDSESDLFSYCRPPVVIDGRASELFDVGKSKRN
jgi:hypothetical protein